MAISQIQITDNSAEVLAASREQIQRALETCGLLAEGYAKLNITSQKAVDTGRLRNSITHKVVEADKAVYIGTNVHYAPYIELGSGIYSETGGRMTPWVWVDDEGVGHYTRGMQPRPYLRPAISDHAKEYENIIKEELKS